MEDKEKQIKLLTKRISKIQNKGVKDIPNFTNIFIDNQELAEELLKYYQPKLPTNSVVLSKEDYEKLKKYEYKVQCGVCFTQEEWFDFINEDSNIRTSLQIKAEEKGYEQAHKEMLKDCIESNKIAEQIGYEKGSKETAERSFEITKKIIDKKYSVETPSTRVTLSNIINQIEKEFAKQFSIEIKE